MKIEIKVLDSSFKHLKGNEETINENKFSMEVLKEESFAFQLLIKADRKAFITLGKNRDLNWTGLEDRIRIDILNSENIFELNFLGYVKGDDESIVGDPILRQKSMMLEEGWQAIWIEGKIPASYDKNYINSLIGIYSSNGYEREELLLEKTVDIKVMDYVLKPVAKGPFHLDLWQHLCSWARAYEVEYFCEDHFEIIENYIKELASLGQRVISLIVTDYPWAGQRCYQVTENPSSLYEYNIVGVKKNINNEIICDFSNLDRYLDICFRHGIDEEINLFGLIGNWDGKDFGNPLEDYRDPLRVGYYDERDNRYDYLRNKLEMKSYLGQVFAYLKDKGLWDKVRIISDEPSNVELFQEGVTFLEECAVGLKVEFKCAIHDQRFYQEYSDKIQSLSLNTCELINNIDQLEETGKNVHLRKGTFTWYSCCFPTKLNIFLKSPLLESRLNGWFTYYWGFDGFLRWSFAIWTRNPFEDIRYKFPKWNAGDMLLVYPGRDLKPVLTVRERNLLFGIQDFTIFKELEDKGINAKEIITLMEPLLGNNEEMKFVPQREVEMNFSLSQKDYLKMRNKLIKEYLL